MAPGSARSASALLVQVPGGEPALDEVRGPVVRAGRGRGALAALQMQGLKAVLAYEALDAFAVHGASEAPQLSVHALHSVRALVAGVDLADLRAPVRPAKAFRAEGPGRAGRAAGRLRRCGDHLEHSCPVRLAA